MSVICELPVPIAVKPFIRQADLQDIDHIQAMFRVFVATSQYRKYVGDSPTHSYAAIEKLLTSEDCAVFVVDAGDALIGMLGLCCFSHPFSGEKLAVEAFWWLNPERRGHGAFLLRHGEKWARAQGAQRLDLMQPVDKARVGQIYEALGYSAVEVTWRKTL